MDLHYSHKTTEVLASLKVNYIIPIFIPGGCTDAHQVCDLVVNKPYKNGVTIGFIAYTSKLFEQWNRTKANDDTCFRMNLALSVMKPEIPSFVELGINALKTVEMKTVIANCFNEAGRVGFARLNETYERATKANAENVMDNDDVVVPQGEEVEAHLGHVDEENCLGVSDFIIEIGREDDENHVSDLSDNFDSDKDDVESSSSTDTSVVETKQLIMFKL